MKKSIAALAALSIVLLCAAALAEPVPISGERFPDERFCAVIRSEFDADGDGFLSDEERKEAVTLYADASDIASVRGLELLPNLGTLDLSGNRVSELDLSANPDLTALNTEGDPIPTLDIGSCPDLAKAAGKGVIYRDGDSVHWSAAELSVDGRTTVIDGDKPLYIPQMLPFLPVNPFEAFFDDDEPSKTAADVTAKEATIYSDPDLTQAVGTIPAFTAVLVDASAVTMDSDARWTGAEGAYAEATACKIVNYGDGPVYVAPSALWGGVAPSPAWTYTTLPAGTALYQRPDLASASTTLEGETAIAILAKRDGWRLIRADQDDVDPYFFVSQP